VLGEVRIVAPDDNDDATGTRGRRNEFRDGTRRSLLLAPNASLVEKANAVVVVVVVVANQTMARETIATRWFAAALGFVVLVAAFFFIVEQQYLYGCFYAEVSYGIDINQGVPTFSSQRFVCALRHSVGANDS
jgi:hypothetical protein